MLIKNTLHISVFTIATSIICFSFAKQLESTALTETKDTRANVQIVSDMYNSFATGNIPAVLANMDPNVEWNEAENFPYADGNLYIGPEAVLEGVFSNEQKGQLKR